MKMLNELFRAGIAQPRVDACLHLVWRWLMRFAWTPLPHKITRCFRIMLTLANSKELSPACEYNIPSATQEIPNSLWNSKMQILFYFLYLKLQSWVWLYFPNCCITRISYSTFLGIYPVNTDDFCLGLKRPDTRLIALPPMQWLGRVCIEFDLHFSYTSTWFYV